MIEVFIENFHIFLNFNIFVILVSGKVDAIEKVPCLHELSILFASFKDNDFDEKMCKKEIDTLKTAHMHAEIEKKEDKLRNSGKAVSTGRKLTSKQLNKYLRRFPMNNTDY